MVARRTVDVDYRRFVLERPTEHRTYVQPAQTYQAGHGAPPQRTYVQRGAPPQRTYVQPAQTYQAGHGGAPHRGRGLPQVCA